MSKRTVFTTVTPLPEGITRQTVMETLHDHLMMIDLNPLVEERHPIKAPSTASPEEFHCQWYSLTDRVQYLPGVASGKVTYNACFHDLANGLQTHVYAPLGLNIKGKWTLGGNLPGEPVAPVELGVGVPLTGLWLREDVDMKCNFMLTSFVKGNLKKSHSTLVSRMLAKAKVTEAQEEHARSDYESQSGYDHSGSDSRSRVESWAASTAPSHPSPPPHQNHLSSHGATYGEEDASLRPRPLSIVSNVTGQSGSRNSGQPGNSAPYQQHNYSQAQGVPYQSHADHDSRQPSDQRYQSRPQEYSTGQRSSSGPAPVELPQANHQEKRPVHEMA